MAAMVMLVSQSCVCQVQIGQDIDGIQVAEEFGKAVSMGDASTVAIGAPAYYGDTELSSGRTQIYQLVDGAWIPKGNDIYGEATSDNSGNAVCMPNSNTVAIGASGNNGNGFASGHVRVFTWDGNTWQQKGLDIDGEAAEDQSGYSVSMPDENTVAIGGIHNDDNGMNAGHVRIYSWDGDQWIQKGGDIDGEDVADEAGTSVSMPDNNTVAVGARHSASNGFGSGKVRVYSWDGGSWIQKGVDIDGEATGDYSGQSISMPDPNTIAIGAPRNDSNQGIYVGHVRVFSWDGNQWIQKGLDIDGASNFDMFGWSVSMPNADTFAAGAPNNGGTGSYAGHVRVFSWDGNAWIQNGNDMNGEESGDQSGESVSMPDATHVAIGAPFNDSDSLLFHGQARVYGVDEILNLPSTELLGEILTIFPNPSFGIFIIEKLRSESMTYSIKDLAGAEVKSGEIPESQIKLDLSDKPAGVYLFETFSGLNIKLTRRLLIQ